MSEETPTRGIATSLVSERSTISIAVDTVTADKVSRVQIGNSIYGTAEDRCLADLRSTRRASSRPRAAYQKTRTIASSTTPISNNGATTEQSRLLCAKGDPGKGKTMLLCGIINELKKETGIDSRINNVTAVLRGLIYLLVGQQPWLISHVRTKYDQAGKDLFEDVNAW
ncbi:hypothetical protein EDB81DRAFT_767586 [Dactylonectria macrodidyma]|uniref:Nephrocystin 3-like N-terminal domain-containing protein n=1 Tax=Dactylonectria macrodidyma TaxID=307937 RepID=A0A9P9DAM5_9HYPO|nr:hypothetical protein EDB81DRAFT_767586 [Dactylonectria macrodidyma]